MLVASRSCRWTAAAFVWVLGVCPVAPGHQRLFHLAVAFALGAARVYMTRLLIITRNV
jgi:hypothetical protein